MEIFTHIRPDTRLDCYQTQSLLQLLAYKILCPGQTDLFVYPTYAKLTSTCKDFSRKSALLGTSSFLSIQILSLKDQFKTSSEVFLITLHDLFLFWNLKLLASTQTFSNNSLVNLRCILYQSVAQKILAFKWNLVADLKLILHCLLTNWNLNLKKCF